MNESILQFAEVMRRYVQRYAYTPGQLARLSGVPQMTIVNWLQGRVKRPRAWQDVVKLARALRLTQDEANELLAAAGYPPLGRLQAQAQNQEEQILPAYWREEKAPSDRQAPFQVIRDLPTFTGRETALRTLEEWLSAAYHVTPVVLEGTAGVGKTVLAARLAYRLRSRFTDGVLWARLDTTNPMTVLRQFAAAYGLDVTGYKDLNSRSTVVRELLAHKRALLVLDNVQTSQSIETLLPASGSCAVLVTTRRRNLTLTENGRRFHLESFAEAETLDLFERILGEEKVAKEINILHKIANAIGHLPPAVDIVACRLAYEPGWTTSDFWVQLQRENSLLNHLVYEERCVRSAFTVSYDQLTPEQQRFFAALGAFGGEDFSVEAAASVANLAVAKAEVNLRAFFCLSLVRRGRLERYRLIPLLRVFAHEKMEEATWQRRQRRVNGSYQTPWSQD